MLIHFSGLSLLESLIVQWQFLNLILRIESYVIRRDNDLEAAY